MQWHDIDEEPMDKCKVLLYFPYRYEHMNNTLYRRYDCVDIATFDKELGYRDDQNSIIQLKGMQDLKWAYWDPPK